VGISNMPRPYRPKSKSAAPHAKVTITVPAPVMEALREKATAIDRSLSSIVAGILESVLLAPKDQSADGGAA
jgi:hypothetical protein